MKALSLWQPWASLCVHGLKQYETRSWGTSYRGLLAIHATKTFPREAQEYCPGFMETDPRYGLMVAQHGLPRAAVLGVVRLVDCIEMTSRMIHELDELEWGYGNWEVGRFAWKLEVVKAFAEPIPASGHQGLWNWEHEPHIKVLPPAEFRYATNQSDEGDYLNEIGAEETPLEWFGQTLSPRDATTVHAFSEFVKRAGPPPIPGKEGSR